MFRSVPFRPTLRELLGKKEASSHKRCGKMLEFSALQLARRPVNLRYPLLHHLYVNSRLNRVGALLIRCSTGSMWFYYRLPRLPTPLKRLSGGPLPCCSLHLPLNPK